MSGLLLLSACDGKGNAITENNLADNFGLDGIPPTLTSVTIKMSKDKNPKPNGAAKEGQSVRIDILASEALMKPTVFINDVEAEVTGSVTKWTATREMTARDVDGMVHFSIGYTDISGEVGASVTATTDGSAVQYCAEGCPDASASGLAGDWFLDGDGAAGVGPTPGSTEWWASTAANGAGVAERPCWFDDIYRFGTDGSFTMILGDETWLEPWQGVPAETCGTPVPPHDGTSTGTWVYDEDNDELTINGTGLHLGLAKAVNGQELSSPGDAPPSITYDVETLDGDTLIVTVEAGSGVWWTFRLARKPLSPLAGKWKLDGDGAAGVGPTPGSVEWWASTAANGAGVDDRPCWFDDVYEFNSDGSFRNILGDETWLEPWQGVPAETCGTPVAPHDGTTGAIFQYDEDASTLKLTGRGAHLGLPKAVNGQELSNPGDTPESVTYDILTFDGDSLTVTVEAGTGVWWTFNLKRVSNSPLIGKWRLAGDGAAGVGPNPGNTEWWASTAANGSGPAERPCWFDDFYHFADDGSFRNYHGAETWLEPWQGVPAESCGAPVSPHTGTSSASYAYDEDNSTLTLDGRGSYIGLPKAVNGQELASPGDTPDSVVYDVLTLDGDTVAVTVEAGAGVWWTFHHERVYDSVPLEGMWRLDGDGAAGVGPIAGSTEWWASTAANGAGPVERDCWFDDAYVFGSDGSFENQLGSETWVEVWQGAAAEGCAAPVAPHDGTATAIFAYDEDASTLTISGRGAHLGLAKAVNGQELASPGDTTEEVVYDVLTLDGDSLTVTVEAGAGVWWTFNLARVSNSPLIGNWKLDGEGAAGVGPSAGNTEWWASTAANGSGPADRACWFDDIFHFGAGGNFQNVQDGDTWLEPWQGVPAESCGAPVSPHDGTSTGAFFYDEGASTLTLRGRGSHVGLPKAVNGQELASPGDTPDFVTYEVLTLDTAAGVVEVTVEAGAGVFWTFRLAKE